MEQVYNRATDPVVTLGKTAVIDVWKGADYSLLKNVTSNGLRAVLSGCWYLDIISGATAWGREWLDYCKLHAVPTFHLDMYSAHGNHYGHIILH